MAAALKTGNKILVCGNGGSAAESQHFVAELVGRFEIPHRKGLQCITMLGKDGGKAAEYGHINLIVPSDSTQRIQEVHLHLVHLLCTIIENRLFNVLYTNKTSAKERQLAVKTNLNTDFAANGSLIGNYGS